MDYRYFSAIPFAERGSRLQVPHRKKYKGWMKKLQEILPPGLYMVATPIGNLEDITLRALRVLRDADQIYAEDTRESKKLLEAHGISKDIHSFHGHSGEQRAQQVAIEIKGGKSVAYVSDAGTPGLCDPGAELINACAELEVAVYPIPGVSALVGAISVSGFLAPSFTFHGFFPREGKERKELAERIRAQGGQHFFYESPHRFLQFLDWARTEFPEEKLLIARELTKKFETIKRGTVTAVFAELEHTEPRGEYVIGMEIKSPEDSKGSLDSLRAEFRELVEAGANQRVLVRVGIQRGLKKNEAYDLALSVLGQK